MKTRLLIAAALAVVLSTGAEARRHHPPAGGPDCDNDGRCVARSDEPGARPAPRRARHAPRAATHVAGSTTILGGRPAACHRFPKTARRWCGCAAADYLGMPNGDGWWNLASHWLALPRAAPAPRMAAVRGSHVSVLERHLGGSIWMAYDPNSGGQLARRHPIDLRRYAAVVDPAGARRKGKEALKTTGLLPASPPQAASEPRPAVPPLLASSGAAFASILDDAREYLVRTATIGGTMARQGPEVALGRLHPTFAVRLAAAVAEARKVPGLERAGCFSPYRPPIFGIGGYANKFDSDHTYGLACDVAGIGRPGSREAKAWHEIARRNGLHNPYFDGQRFAVTCGRRGCRPMTWEWNHYAATPFVRAVAEAPALRKTVDRYGPIDAIKMWRAADALIDRKLDVVTASRRAIRGRRYASVR